MSGSWTLWQVGHSTALLLRRRSRNQKGCVSTARESVRSASRARSVESESVLPSHSDPSEATAPFLLS